MQKFVKHLLRDVEALEYMLENDWFEREPIRIGAEQEMVMIDKQTFKPAPIAVEAMELMKEFKWIDTELARFNLEVNLDPQIFRGDCLSKMENQARDCLNIINEKLDSLNATILLTGILPTLRKYDLEMHNMTPKTRYKALLEAIDAQLLGSAYELRLLGIDELIVKHNSPMMEACNTSFQVHLQVTPDNFARLYNISQVLSAPILAVSANSPIVFGRRLWHESRIALFQQALDTRASHEHMRERSPRVSFGHGWVQDSILDIYKEDISRFRVLISSDVEEDSLELIKQGRVPRLNALQVHNSTVYRWNRPCYGISDTGKPHLRIENRVLAAGPTLEDEMANAALWLGAMVGYGEKLDDVSHLMNWADVRDNFGKAARYGLETKFCWMEEERVGAADLILREVLPTAREGLEKMEVDPGDIDRYLGIIQKRAEKLATGANWMLRAYTKLLKTVPRDEAVSVLTSTILENQISHIPVHKWELPDINALSDYRPRKLKVDEFMTTDLFTARKEDLVDLVADMMNWRKIRYMPVENQKGELIGLITSRHLLRYFARQYRSDNSHSTTVEAIMVKEPITISPEQTIIDAMNLMRENMIGCLPVVKERELVGIITEMDFLRISGRLIERLEE